MLRGPSALRSSLRGVLNNAWLLLQTAMVVKESLRDCPSPEVLRGHDGCMSRGGLAGALGQQKVTRGN